MKSACFVSDLDANHMVSSRHGGIISVCENATFAYMNMEEMHIMHFSYSFAKKIAFSLLILW